MNDIKHLLTEYSELADEQRRLLENEAYDELDETFNRASELRDKLGEALRVEAASPAVREEFIRLGDKLAENSKLLTAQMKELGKSNARRADIRRGLAGYDPMPFTVAEIIDINM
ncbi:MAG: hypothetical protein LBC28_00270 [Oscillospiraceae bacterium]|jgi:hypothetical protein|nr:hypothetical protein [Oscillospiraceae bacterium]